MPGFGALAQTPLRPPVAAGLGGREEEAERSWCRGRVEGCSRSFFKSAAVPEQGERGLRGVSFCPPSLPLARLRSPSPTPTTTSSSSASWIPGGAEAAWPGGVHGRDSGCSGVLVPQGRTQFGHRSWTGTLGKTELFSWALRAGSGRVGVWEGEILGPHTRNRGPRERGNQKETAGVT